MNKKIKSAIEQMVLFEDTIVGEIFPLFDDEDGIAYFQLEMDRSKIGLWEGDVVCWSRKTKRCDRAWVRITARGVDFDDMMNLERD